MRQKSFKLKIYHLFLLLLPGLTIELFSGSTPPLNYFNIVTIFFFTIAYGMTLILLRELKIRWQLTWQFMFLIPLTGIFIEGIFMQSFFNIGHEDLGILSNFGVLWSVQWPWAINLIIMHGIFSVVVPLMIMDLLFPNFKYVPILNTKSVTIHSISILLLTAFQLFIINTKKIPMFSLYNINWTGTLTWVLISCLLVYLAYKSKDIELKSIPNKKGKWSDHFIAFVYLILLLLATYFLAYIHVTLVIIGQVTLVILLIRFAIRHIYRPCKSTEELVPYLNGCVLYFSLFAILQGYNLLENIDPTDGMDKVAYIFILFQFYLNIKVAISQKPSSTASSASS